MTQARRRGSRLQVAARGVWLALWAALSMLLLRSAGAKLTEPASPIAYYGAEPAAPRVFVRGTLQRAPGSDLPALCEVTYQEYKKGRFWSTKTRMTSALGTLDVEWSSPPTPSKMTLSPNFSFGYRVPTVKFVPEERARAWEQHTKAAGLEPLRPPDAPPSTSRVTERCLDAGKLVFIEACVSPSNAERLEPCPGDDGKTYLVVPGGIRPEITQQASSVASRVGWAALALLMGLLGLLREPAPLIEGLASRALLRPRPGPDPRWAQALGVGVCVVALLAMIESVPPLGWLRAGFLWALLVLGFWIFAALRARARGAEVLSALAPVLETPRSLLAHATGAVELAVRARMRDRGVLSFLGGDAVAFSQLRITEVAISRTSPSRVVFDHRQGDVLEIVDESGDGALHLADAILDVEVRRARVRLLPHYAAGKIPAPRRARLYYLVEERVIRDGEPLYVYGDVSGVALRTGEAGYRSVRGAPTLGGAGAPPVLVYAGDERGLTRVIAAHARQAKSVGIAALVAVAVFGAALAYLASL